MKIILKRDWMNNKKGRILDLVEPVALRLIHQGTAKQHFDEKGSDKMIKKSPITK